MFVSERGRENMGKKNIHIHQCVYTHTYISHMHIAEPFAIHYPLKQSKHEIYMCEYLSKPYESEVQTS